MQTVTIEILGCDDTTAFTFTATQEELKVVRRLQLLSHQTSTHDCEPVIDVYRGDIVEKDGSIDYRNPREPMWDGDQEDTNA